MFELGVEEEVRQALAGPISATARKTMGLDEIAQLPRTEAITALTARTRRYASYQRKWMRSLEGVVMVAADRPPEETAAEIVDLARARERLSRP
jgi:tRNA A37 N6-isopentenylltransferase MiaA